MERYIDKKGSIWCLQDAKKYKELWKILCRSCHPSPDRYPKSYSFFGEIQSNSEVMRRGWNSILQNAYDKKDYTEVLRLLSQRPSEFIRRYDSLIRLAWGNNDLSFFNEIQDQFMKISGVPGKVLLELYEYYDKRGEEIQRSFLDQRGVRHFYSSLPNLPQEIVDLAQVGILSTIYEGWKKKDTFKDKIVYIDLPDDIRFTLSFRGGVSDKTDPMYPGQKIKFPTSGMIRFFSQWIDPMGTKDLDLHAWLISDVGDFKEISWHRNFNDISKFVSHSGDIRHQKGDCAEYVTIDYTKDFSYTWMLVTVQNYDSDRLCDVENWIGISQVSDDKTTSIFRGKVTSEVKNMSAFIVNLKEGWAELILEGVEANVLTSGANLIKQYTSSNYLDVKNLLVNYVEHTGGKVIDCPLNEDEEIIVLGEEDLLSGKIHEYLLG